MALAHKGVTARLLPWHFGDKKLPGGVRQVPVLVDGGEVIVDSTTIARHLEHKYPNGPSLFGGEGGEAHVRFVVAWADSVLIPVLLPIVAPDLLRLVQPAVRASFREARERRMGMTFEAATRDREHLVDAARAALAPLRTVLQEHDFLGGDEPSYADYAVFGPFQWMRCAGTADILAQDDPIVEWRERILDLFGDLARGATLAA
jgi:glutathione S-transferase